ncbi:MAG: hypothetical protein K2W33_20290 [Burkholderiales bacterium]|nr:hypothetical protein [Burkholderiales bacterium]
MKMWVAMGALALGVSAAQAQMIDEVYAGLGTGGLTLGLSKALGTNMAARIDYTGGFNIGKSGRREGVDFEGKLKMSSAGAYVDYFPFDNGFRVTGGLTLNSTKVQLNSRGGSATINGKPVDLSNYVFNVAVAQPNVTPYIGIGFGHKPANGKGLGYHLDVGAQIGKFKTTVSTNVVGVAGITQADVDAEAAKVRDNVGKLKLMPVLSAGLDYRF